MISCSFLLLTSVTDPVKLLLLLLPYYAPPLRACVCLLKNCISHINVSPVQFSVETTFLILARSATTEIPTAATDALQPACSKTRIFGSAPTLPKAWDPLPAAGRSPTLSTRAGSVRALGSSLAAPSFPSIRTAQSPTSMSALLACTTVTVTRCAWIAMARLLQRVKQVSNASVHQDFLGTVYPSAGFTRT